MFRPHVIGPEQIPQITEPDEAARDLPLAGLSVTAHGKGDPATAARIALAIVKAATDLDDENHRLLYSGLIESALSEAAKEILRMMPEAPKWFSESQRKSFDKGVVQGKAEGKAAGKAEALLTILAKRGLPVTEELRRRIGGCTDLAVLDHWLDRAFEVASADELLR